MQEVIKIVKESISSVVCIDDHYDWPFECKNAGNTKKSLDMYQAFHNLNSCSVDLVPYERNVDYGSLLSGKDLLVLDWELDETSSEENLELLPLEVIRKAIDNDVQFICIYTRKSTSDLQIVKNVIKGYFSGITWEECEKVYVSCEKQNNDLADYKDKINYFVNEEAFEKAKAQSGASFVKSVNCWNRLACYFMELKLRPVNPKKYTCNLGEISDVFVINGKYVCCFSSGQAGKKAGVEPDKIIEKIAEIIWKNNVYDVLWLYYFTQVKQALKDKSSLYRSVSKNALIYFSKTMITNLGEKDSFYPTMFKILSDEVSLKMKLKNVSVPQSIEQGIKDEIGRNIGIEFKTVSNQLARLNEVLNKNIFDTQNEHSLMFGDVFYLDANVFYLCITAKCDCAHHNDDENGSSFCFLKGQSLNQMPDNPETGLYSFVLHDGVCKIIEWNKNIIYMLANSTMPMDGTIKLKNWEKESELHFVCTIKDEYAQRMANEAFAWGQRVGTTFAKCSEDERRIRNENEIIQKAEKIQKERDAKLSDVANAI